MWFFRSFPQENEKNNRATMISVKLISVAPAACGTVKVLNSCRNRRDESFVFAVFCLDPSRFEYES
jgi:hypothetical protein